MELRYRLHRVILNYLQGNNALLILQIVDRDGHHWPVLRVDAVVDPNQAYASAFENAFQVIDEACASRLANPWDENQPSY